MSRSVNLMAKLAFIILFLALVIPGYASPSTCRSTLESLTARERLETKQGPSRYPIILLHGLFGGDKLGPFEYFYKVEAALNDLGYEVYFPALSPISDLDTRVEELMDFVDQVLLASGAEKVNLISYSSGGIDARYLISHYAYGDRVASLTTIGTPHRGTPAIKIGISLMKNPNSLVARALNGLLSWIFYTESRLFDSLSYLSQEYMSEFNSIYLDDERVFYQSYAGITDPLGVSTGDIMNPILLPFYEALQRQSAGENDGVVSVDSAKWGWFRGTLRADHLKLIGHFPGTASRFFNHLDLYRSISQDLKYCGF